MPRYITSTLAPLGINSGFDLQSLATSKSVSLWIRIELLFYSGKALVLDARVDTAPWPANGNPSDIGCGLVHSPQTKTSAKSSMLEDKEVINKISTCSDWSKKTRIRFWSTES